MVITSSAYKESRNSHADKYVGLRQSFLEDGVVLAKGVLSEEEMLFIEQIFDRQLNEAIANNSEGLEEIYPGTDTEFYFYTTISINHDPDYQTLIAESEIADLAQGLFGGHEVFYWADQLWSKPGGARRSPWHQDSSYIPYAGMELVNLWIPLIDLPADSVLEVVRKSHIGTLYNGMTYDYDDDTAPLYDEKALPRLPDIQADRSSWDIFSTDMKRGDILAFHPSCLHGGGPTSKNERRKTLVFRMLSDNAVYSPLPSIDVRDDVTGNRKTSEESVLYEGFRNLKPGQSLCSNGKFTSVRKEVYSVEKLRLQND